MIVTLMMTILLIILFVVNCRYSKDILSPVSVFSFLYAIIFFTFVIFNIICNSNYWLGFSSIYFVIGVVIFSVGFYLSQYVYNKYYNGKNKVIEINCYDMTNLYKIIVVVSFIVSVIYICHYTISSWEYINWSFKRFLSVNKHHGFTILPFYAIHQTFSLVLYYISCYILFNKYYKNKDLVFHILVIISAIFHTIMIGSRTHLFKMIIPIIFMYLYTIKDNKKKLLKHIIFCLAFLIIFIASFTFIIRQPVSIDFLRCYLHSGVVAFLEWAKKPELIYNGKYTFRLLFAILHKLGLYNGVVPWIEMGYLEIPELDWTLGNVYTFYHGYSQDFGIIYALFVQFIISLIHGFIYIKAKDNNDLFWRVIFVISYFPLSMHFFTDNYFVMASYWIQITIFTIVLCKTNLFLIKS